MLEVTANTSPHLAQEARKMRIWGEKNGLDFPSNRLTRGTTG